MSYADLPKAFHIRVLPNAITTCKEWVGCKLPKGYGIFNLGKTRTVHRIAYEAEYGEIPKGLVIDHLCRNKACVNPGHLEAVTQAENIRRGQTGKYTRPYIRRNERNAPTLSGRKEKTHCPHGHPYEGDNLYVTNKGVKTCRTCRKRSYEKHLERKCQKLEND